MPQQFDFDDDDDFTDESSNDSALVKQLRKQVKDQARQLKELSEQATAAQRQNRERSIADVLSAKGINPKVAKFIPQDIEATSEAIEGWVTEYADVFGVQVAPPATEQVDSPQAAAYERMRLVEDTSQTASGDAALQQRLAAAGNREELAQIMAQHGRAAV